MKNKLILTISIVNFESEKFLLDCLGTIEKFKPPFNFEIIIFDNSPYNNIKVDLDKRLLNIKYIRSLKNLGYAKSHNIALKMAKGEYFFILNPDTKLLDRKIWLLMRHLDNNKIAIVGPRIVNTRNQIEQSISDTPHPLKGFFYYSFIDKYFPQNYFSRNFWYRNKDWNKEISVGSLSGVALFIKNTTFKLLNGFDENFFLYFEDTDLCLRALKLAKINLYSPESKIHHYKGGSGRKIKYISKIFQKSRYLFFKKHYSLLKALILECFLRPFEYFVYLKRTK